MMPPLALLCGGRGTRLQSLTQTIPKALMPVAGEPFIAHQLRLLKRGGLKKVVICSGYLGEQIEAFIGAKDAFGLEIYCSHDGDSLLGTGGAIKKALPHLSKTFFVMYGDSYLDVDFQSVWTAFERSGKTALLTVFHNEGKWDTSNVELVKGVIRRYDKKNRTPAMRYIDYGLCLLTADVFDPWPSGLPFDLADVYKKLAEEGRLGAFEVKKRFYEIGSEGGLAETEAWLRKMRPI